MPNFTDSVGRGGKNALADVAALQGAFLILAQKGQKFWHGQIDGKMSGDLIAGILAFEKQIAGQAAAKTPSKTAGLLQPSGPITRQLKAQLPPQYQSLKGIPETACLTVDDPYPRTAEKEKLKGMALHDAFRKDLDRLIKAGADKLGLTLVLDEERTDHKGRCIFTLKPHGVKCLDANMRPQDAKNIPRPVVAAVAKHAASATTLDMPINASKMEVTTRQAQGSAASQQKQSSGPVLGSSTPPPTAMSWGVDWAFVTRSEGGRRLDMYWPKTAGSGCTIATGVDIGQMDDAELRRHVGANPALYAKLRPYLLHKGMAAKQFLVQHPLVISDAEALQLDELILKGKYNILETDFDARRPAGTISFLGISAGARTVILSLAWNLGQNIFRSNNKNTLDWITIKAALRNDWVTMADELQFGTWPQIDERRRREEGEYLFKYVVSVSR